MELTASAAHPHASRSVSPIFLWFVIFAIALSPFTGAQGAETPIDLPRLKVKAIDHERRIVVFDAEKGSNVALDDQVLVCTARGEFAVGRVFVHDGGHLAINIGETAPMPAVGDAAVRVPNDVGELIRSWMPPGSTLTTRLDARSPSGATAWFDCGSRDGIRAGDRLLVMRNEIPIARATVAEARDRVSLASIVPLVSNVSCNVGDMACLWPGPSDLRTDTLETRVLFVKAVPQSDRIEVWLPIEKRDGAAVGQHWEIRRAGEYVDCVEVVDLRGRFAIALQSAAFAASPIAVGDSAALRTGQHVAQGRISLRVFRRDGDYCLMNGGEDVGLEVGGHLAVVRDGRTVAELEIDTVKVDYCGASRTVPAGHGNLLATTRPGRESGVRDWDAVVPLMALPFMQESAGLGRVEQVIQADEWLVGRPGRIGASVAAGQLVRVGGPPASIGIVVFVADGRWAVYVPRSCRRGSIATGDSISKP